MLAELDVRAGQMVLDLGCGPGTDLAALAAVIGTGAVISVARDPAMVDAARARTADQPVVDVRLGDVHDLALPDRFADRARPSGGATGVRGPRPDRMAR